jgi:hypothetical protein
VKVTVVLPPHALGAPVLLFVNVPPQPPLAEAEANQLVNWMLMAACVWHAPRVTFCGQVSTTGAGAATVKVAVQVEVNGAHVLVYVKVTVVEPPHALGAPALLFDRLPLHPPVAEAVASQLAKAASTAACVWQSVVVVFTGQVSTTGSGAATVKVASQVVVNGSQELV